jgi:hypothetical protein
MPVSDHQAAGEHIPSWRRITAINVDSVFLGCRHLGHDGLDPPPEGRSIVNIASAAGLVPWRLSAYCMARPVHPRYCENAVARKSANAPAKRSVPAPRILTSFAAARCQRR